MSYDDFAGQPFVLAANDIDGLIYMCVCRFFLSAKFVTDGEM